MGERRAPLDGVPGRAGAPRVQRVGFWLGLALFALLLAAPGLPLEPVQRRAAAVTALTATWWITVALPIGATSLLPAALLPLLGVMPASEVAPRYMHDLVLLFLGAFLLALGLQRWGVHRRIALAVLARVGTRPRSLVLGFMVAAALLSMWISNTATTLLMLPIGVAVVASVGGSDEPGTSAFATSLFLGMAYAASVGGIGTPVGTAPNQIFLGIFRDAFPEAPPISFAQWMISFLPLVVLFLPVCWLLLTRVALRVEPESAAGSEVVREERARLGPATAPERRMALAFAATALLWVTRADLDLGFAAVPGWNGLVPGEVSDATVAIAMALVCFAVPARGRAGPRLLDWETARRVPWEILLLFGGGFAIARAFQVSGLDRVLGELLGPALGGLPPWAVVLVVAAFMTALTEVTSNTATTAVLLPVLGSAAEAARISPLLAMLPAAIAASAAFMLPVATPPNAVVFASGHVPAPTMARVGLWVNVAAVLLVTLVFHVWVRRVLGIEAALPHWSVR